MRALRLDLAVGQHEDAVGHADAGEAVGDQHRRLAGAQLLEAPEHLVFGTGVESGGRLVEDQHLGLAHVGAGDGDLLPFAAGQLDAVLEALADHLVVAAGQARDHLVGLAAVGGPRDAFVVGARRDPADRDIVAGRQVVADEVLEDDAHAAAQFVEPVVAQVASVEQDAALVGVVEPRQQLHQRGLARAVLADQRHHLAGLQGEGKMAHRPTLGAVIDEADILEHEAVANRPGKGQGIGRRMDFRPDREEGEEIVEIERLARDG